MRTRLDIRLEVLAKQLSDKRAANQVHQQQYKAEVTAFNRINWTVWRHNWLPLLVEQGAKA